MPIPPAPKFQKRIHHIVPVFWQNAFAAPGEVGPWYKNIKTGKRLNPQGPGEKMAVELANIVFDEYYRPSDRLENQFSEIETKASVGLAFLEKNKSFDENSRCDIAMLLATQACRYPEEYQRRLDIGKYLAIMLGDLRHSTDTRALNAELCKRGIPIEITAAEFTRLTTASDKIINSEIEDIICKYGYEADFNPDLILAAAIRVAEHLLGLKWRLVVTSTPSLILSDHPVPSTTGLKFSVGLTHSLGLFLDDPGSHTVETVDVASATATDIEALNAEVRSRAIEWLCGPGAFVHSL